MRLHLARGSDAVPPGRMPFASSSPVTVLIGAARPIPMPSRWSRSMSALLSTVRTSSWGGIEALDRGVVDLGGRPLVDDWAA